MHNREMWTAYPLGVEQEYPSFCLRQLGQENYSLVGEAYVYGTIGGESFSGGEWDTQGLGIR